MKDSAEAKIFLSLFDNPNHRQERSQTVDSNVTSNNCTDRADKMMMLCLINRSNPMLIKPRRKARLKENCVLMRYVVELINFAFRRNQLVTNQSLINIHNVFLRRCLHLAPTGRCRRSWISQEVRSVANGHLPTHCIY
jgi:hypothetical protein